MNTPSFKARECDQDGKPYVETEDGTGNGFSYYSGTLYPESRFSTYEDARAGAFVANEAYRMGYLKAQTDIRRALGCM